MSPQEVSVRAVMPFVDAWRKAGHPIEELTARSGVSASRLTDADGWLTWEAWERLCETAETRITLAEWEELGAGSARGPWHRVLGLVAWLLPDELALLRWTAGQATGPGGYAFRTMQMRVESVAPRRIRVILDAPAGRALPTGFAHAALGAFRAFPRLLGGREADVEMRIGPGRATYSIRLAEKSLLRRAAGTLTWAPLSALLAGRELKRLQEALTSDRAQLRDEASRRAEAEEEQERLRRRLAQAERMEAIGRLAGGVAHDFNNLLTVILANADLLRLDAPASMTGTLDVVIDAAERAAELTDQLLALSRQHPIHHEVIDVGVELDALGSVLRGLVRPGVTLTVQNDVVGVRAALSRAALQRILGNLVANASDALDGRGHIRVEAAAMDDDPGTPVSRPPAGGAPEPGPRVRLEVRDDGPGVPPEVAERMFEPFYSTKERGTGLGLASVYGLVHQHGGTIRVDSEMGRGTSIVCELPVVELPATRPISAPRSPATTGATVWVVEDEPHVRDLVLRALSDAGYHARAFEGARSAWDALEETSRPPDLLLSDVIMPGMRGDALARMARERYPHLPIVLMSGYPGEWRGEQRELGDVTVLEKPFRIGELLERVRAGMALGAVAES